MNKEVYEINDDGFIVERFRIEFDDEGKPTNDLPEGNLVLVDLPQPNLYRSKWTGTEWIEDMSQAEIDEMTKPKKTPLTDIEILSQLLTERELEIMLQGQQLVAFELKLAELEAKLNV